MHDIALIRLYLMQPFFPGDHGARVIPVPIPNTEVKTRCGDGTASFGGGRVARCQDFFRAGLFVQTGLFCVRIFVGRPSLWRGSSWEQGSGAGAQILRVLR